MNSPVASSRRVSPVTVSRSGDALQPVVAVQLDDLGVPGELDLLVGERAVLHDLGGAELVAAVHQGDLGGEPGEERGLLDGGVAAADDHDVLVAEEEAVARRAPADAVAGEAVLALDLELAVARAHGQHDGAGAVRGAVGDADGLDVALEMDGRDVVGDQDGAEPLGLGAELVHQLGAHDAVGEAGVVLDVGGVDERTAGRDRALEHQRGEVRARRVDGSGVARGAGADDDQVTNVVAHARSALCWELIGATQSRTREFPDVRQASDPRP